MKIPERKINPKPCHLTPITTGFLASPQYLNQLFFTPLTSEKLSLDSNNLIIYSMNPKLTRITCYPVPYKSIWKLIIHSKALSQEILCELIALIKNHTLVHTTGLSRHQNQFRVEQYISPGENWELSTELLSKIESNTLEFCSIEQIRLDDFLEA